MKSVLFTLLIATLALGAWSCRSSRQAPQPAADTVSIAPDAVDPGLVVGGGNVAYIPKARIYRTTGDYNDNVPVSLNAAGTGLASYPAPTDLSQYSLPLPLVDGFLLDRRGITASSVFTRYTYQEYMALKEVPSPKQLMEAIIPGASVSEIVELPFTQEVALADTAAVNTLIRDGLPGCKVIYTQPRIEL